MTCSEIHSDDIVNLRQDLADFRSTTVSKIQDEQEIIDSLLDRILDLQKDIRSIYEPIQDIIPRLEKISWYTDLDESSIASILEIIALSKEIHSNLIKFYVRQNNTFRSVAKKEIKSLKLTIDDLKETYQDLEFTFSYAANDSEIQEVTRKMLNM